MATGVSIVFQVVSMFVCWFCSDCCCISTYRRVVNLSQFVATYGN